MSKLKVGGICSGIAGLELGLVRAGFEISWMVEKDKFCQAVLRKHAPEYWPNVEIFGDVKEVGKNNLKPVDLICGGLPCQPHSIAGKRLGASDDRDLWPEYRRIIAELRPTWIIIENVPGIIKTILDKVLSDLESLNYSWEAFIIPACAVNAPHRRNRLFVIAHTELSGREIVLCNNVENINKTDYTRAWPASTPLATIWEYISQLEKMLGQPCVFGNDDGVPRRVDRLGAIGNAVIPQISEFFGELIIRQANNGLHRTGEAGQAEMIF